MILSREAHVLGACPTLTFLLRRTIRDHLRRSRPEKILNVFQRIHLRFFQACGLASGRTSFASSRQAMSDRLFTQYNQMGLFPKGWRVRHALSEDGTLITQERKNQMVSSWRNGRMGIAGIVFVIVCTLGVAEGVLAGDNKTEEPAKVVDQVGTAVKHMATKIEQEVSGVVKKLEESETPKKVGNELKRSAESLAGC